MGAERVLQAALRLAGVTAGGISFLGLLGLCATAADAAPWVRERVAVIDLGPGDGAVRGELAARVTAAGLVPVDGDGLEDALSGRRVDLDVSQLAAAISDAQRAFGALDCPGTITASRRAVGIAAARQAAGIPAPELRRAWTYLMLCADRGGDIDGAMHAATRLRTVGGSTDVPQDLLAKYPEVDTAIDRDMVPLDITADVPGAEIWIDFARAGTSPLHVLVPAGEHVIAASSGARRGWASGTAVRSQTKVTVLMADQTGPWTPVAERVASWNGRLPAPSELAWVFDHVNARIALVRHGDTIDVWGRIVATAPPRRLGGDDGRGLLSEVDRVLALVIDRVQAWNERAPDPDQPLLVEDRARDRLGHRAKDGPTKWWIYASILGAVAAAAAIVYVHDSAPSTQRVELHYP